MIHPNGSKETQKNRIVANHIDKGFFVGAVNGYAVFSKDDPYYSYQIYGFASKKTAMEFFENSLPKLAADMNYIEVGSHSEYVSVIDLIKAGVNDLEDLFLNLPVETEFYC